MGLGYWPHHVMASGPEFHGAEIVPAIWSGVRPGIGGLTANANFPIGCRCQHRRVRNGITTSKTMNEPFGRQPKSVLVRIDGEREDVDYWLRELTRRAEFKGDQVQIVNNIKGVYGNAQFRIHPRAVND
jgi:hypothetical protein